MEDLVEFLMARLYDEERDAELAMQAILPVGMVSDDVQPEPPLDWPLRRLPAAVQQHIAYWDPPRVLADIAAKRAILDEFTWEGGETRAVMQLAQVYADHPEFRPEWRL